MSGAERGPIEHDNERRARSQDVHRQIAQGMGGAPGMAAYILRLQRTIGNQAVGRLLRRYQAQQRSPQTTSGEQRGRAGDRAARPTVPVQRIYLQEGEGSPQWATGRVPQGYVYHGQHDDGEHGKAVLYVKRPSEGGQQQLSEEHARVWQEALANHNADRSKLEEAVRAGVNSQNRLLRNSCEWILQRKNLLAVTSITLSPDMKQKFKRQDFAEPDPGEALYFPNAERHEGNVFAAPTPIDPNAYNLEHLFIQSASMQAWAEGGMAVFPNARYANEQFLESRFRHEIQHIADRHEDKVAEMERKADKSEEEEDGKEDIASNLKQYKTEYRAHIYQSGEDEGETSAYGEFTGFSNTKEVEKYGFTWKEKQLKVFEQIFALYEHTSTGWGYKSEKVEHVPITRKVPKERGEDNTPADIFTKEERETFQAGVVSYKEPDTEGMNRFNSIRIDALVTALKELQSSKVPLPLTNSEQLGDRLVSALTALNPRDAQYILTGGALELRALFDDVLSGEALDTVSEALGEQASSVT